MVDQIMHNNYKCFIKPKNCEVDHSEQKSQNKSKLNTPCQDALVIIQNANGQIVC